MIQEEKNLNSLSPGKKIYLTMMLVFSSSVLILTLSLVANRQSSYTRTIPRAKSETGLPTVLPQLQPTGADLGTGKKPECPQGKILTRVSKFKKEFEGVQKLNLEDEASYDYEWRCEDSGELSKQVAKPQTFSDLFCGCPDTYKPVCGNDYNSYQNSCTAACLEKEIAYQGECRIYKKEVLPSNCQACQISCKEGDVFYEDENGCPYCECRLGEGEW